MTRSTVTPTQSPNMGSSVPADTATFDVLVLSTMSAGKTSFINALIGQERLNTANEATTACVTLVEHSQGTQRFSGACYCYNDPKLPVSTGTNRPILLKKSAANFKAEKYASEIEVLNFRRAFQTEISRRRALKGLSLTQQTAFGENRLFQQNRPEAAYQQD